MISSVVRPRGCLGLEASGSFSGEEMAAEMMKDCKGAEQAPVGGEVRLGKTKKIQAEELQEPASARVPDICLQLRAESLDTSS